MRKTRSFRQTKWSVKNRCIWFSSVFLLLTTAGGVALYLVGDAGITPRALGPYLERRSDGHHALIEGAGRLAGNWLVGLDRGVRPLPATAWSGRIGMQASDRAVAPSGMEVVVSDSAGLARAFATAQSGQVITLLPGSYRIRRTLEATRPGQAGAPIVVRAEQAGSARLEIEVLEGIRVSAPHWRFENLTLQGVCRRDDDCEHAFHVVGKAEYFVARNNLLLDFNAHIKINGSKGRFPDHGLFDSNTLRNEHVRDTTRPVTPIDLVTASNWTIRHNLISDFIKGRGNRTSYGAFAKGGGGNNLLEQNVVICEDRLRGAPGSRVGLSLGGGGTGKRYCRDGKCITEQDGSTLRANLIAACSDDGIYLNAAAQSKILHNTLVDTGGISVRFPASSADVEGNLVDGIIRARDGGLLRETDNLHSSVARLYVGSHPQRALFRDPVALDLRWRDEAPRRAGQAMPPPDLCATTRPAAPRYGAFEDFAPCMADGASTPSN